MVKTSSRCALALALAFAWLLVPRPALPNDAIAPAVPRGLEASIASCSRVDLTWEPSTDDDGTEIHDYRLYRNDHLVALVSSTTAVQIGLAASSDYSWTVSAVDASGNQSARSAPVTATTPPCPDRTPPTTPTGLTAASSASCDRIDLGWNASIDVGGSALEAYRVYRNGALAMEVAAPATLAADIGLAPSSTYSYAVAAIDHAGNESPRSLPVLATTPACPAGPPAVPSVMAVATHCHGVFVTWLSPADPKASEAAAYLIYRNGLFHTFTIAPVVAFDDATVAAATSYTYTVVAITASGGRSAESAPARVTTPACPDTTPPMVPGNLTAVASACDRVQLAWEPSTDDGSGLKEYTIRRNDTDVGQVSPPSTSMVDTGPTPATRLTYTVAAVDQSGNRSAESNVAVVTTPPCPNQRPVADAGPDRARKTLTGLSFSGAGSVDPDGIVTSWVWSFGDGTSAAGVSTLHVYTRAGSYTVTLTVTDDGGLTATDTATVQITGRAPIASAGPDRAVTSRDAIRFDGSASYDIDGSIATYAWSFGDGTSAGGVGPAHAYVRPGSYTVTLTVTDDTGLGGKDTARVQVANQVPLAVAGPDQQVTTTDDVLLDALGSSDADGTVVAYGWSFGDGQSATGATVHHAYAAPGTYVVTLTVTDDLGSTARDTAVITVTEPVPANAKPWAKRLGGPGYDEARAVAVDASGNVLVTGQTTGPFDLEGTLCNDSIFVARFTSAGSLLWARCFGTDAGGGGGRAVAADASGNVLVTGYFRGTVDLGGGPLASGDGYDLFLAKYSSSGAHLWSQRFGAPIAGAIVTDSGNGLAVDRDDTVILTGAFEGEVDLGGGALVSAGQTDVFVAKYAPTGKHLWSRGFGGPYADSGNAVALNADGDVIVTGTFFGPADLGGGPLPSSSFDVFLAAYSASGSHLWSQHLGGALADEGRAVAIDRDANVVVTGTFSGTADLGGAPLVSAGGSDAFLAKYSRTGQHLWSRGLGGTSSFDGGSGVAVDGQGEIAVTGFFSRAVDFGGLVLTSAGSKDVFVARYSPFGVLRSAQSYGGTSIDTGTAVAIDREGPLVVAGSFLGTVDLGGGPVTSAGQTDMLLLRLEP